MSPAGGIFRSIQCCEIRLLASTAIPIYFTSLPSTSRSLSSSVSQIPRIVHHSSAPSSRALCRESMQTRLGVCSKHKSLVSLSKRYLHSSSSRLLTEPSHLGTDLDDQSSSTGDSCTYTPSLLAKIRQQLLPIPSGENREDLVKNNFVPRNPKNAAAVLVPLCHQDHRLGLLFQKRTDTVGTHKGQVCFPGGKVEADRDHNMVQTALREAEEEIGVHIEPQSVLGMLPEALSLFQMHVTPVVAFLGEYNDLKLNVQQEEVECCFWLSVQDLRNPLYHAHDHHHETKKMRAVYDTMSVPEEHPSRYRTKRYTPGPWPVWGLTAHFVHELIQVLDHIDRDDNSV